MYGTWTSQATIASRCLQRKAKSLERIDTLLENAGVATSNFTEIGGNESTITINVISTFLLVLVLLPKLRETSQKFSLTPTLTIVSSEVHFFTSFPERQSSTPIFTTLDTKSSARMNDRYNISKLLEVLACRQITKEHPVEKTKVTINFVNPGWCHSELMREVRNPIVKLLKLIMCRTTEVGSRTLVDAGLKGPESHGKYLSSCRITSCAPLVDGPEGPEMQKRVWEELSRKLEEIEPGVLKALDA